MKLRHPLAISLAARGIATFVRCLIGSQKFIYEPLAADYDHRRPGFPGRYIYSFWHENILMPAGLFSRPNCHVLVSKHADGELIAQTAQRLGCGTVRGSSSRGGTEALRAMLKLGEHDHLVVTPDGPRGPRRVIQPGIIFVASRTGLPIVPCGIGYDRPWRAKSWDRFAIPKPFRRTVLVTTEALTVPPDANRETLEAHRLKLQALMDRSTELAERRASGRTVQLRAAA